MPTVTVDLAKAHMNLDHDADNALIELYIEAAEQFLANHIGKHPSAFAPVSADLRLAVVRLVAFYYSNRESAFSGSAMQIAPFSVISTAENYRVSHFGMPVEEAVDDF